MYVTRRTLFLLVLVGSGYGGDDFKRWVPNTNFETAANWEGGRVPCANDHVRFPENVGIVFIQTNTTITELILPLTGELVLGDHVSLSFPLESSYTPGCPTNREVKYTRTSPKSWFDPASWCVTAAEGGGCQAEQPALLVSEQLPCRTDTVSFPLRSSFLVGLGYGADIYAGSLLIGGKHYTTSSFKALVDSTVGRRTWVRADGSPATTVTLTSQRCTDTSGCACGNDRGLILEKICGVSRGQCELDCTYPVKVIGTCCDICGAVIKLDIGSDFNKKDTENMILSNYVHGDEKYKDIKSIVSKTSLGQIQIVLTDSGNGELSSEVAYSLKREFEDNSKYDVSKIKIDASKNTAPTTGKQKGIRKGPIVGIVTAALIAAIIVALILYFIIGTKRRPSIAINLNFEDIKSTFRNLGKPHGSANLELGTVSFNNTPGTEDLSYGFDNPMYGDIGAVQEMTSPSVKEQHPTLASAMMTPTKLQPAGYDDGFSNPLYGFPALSLDFGSLGEETTPGGRNANEPVAVQLTFPDASAGGFSNPVFGSNFSTSMQVVDAVGTAASLSTPVQTNDSAVLVLNPVFSSNGVDEDSFI